MFGAEFSRIGTAGHLLLNARPGLREASEAAASGSSSATAAAAMWIDFFMDHLSTRFRGGQSSARNLVEVAYAVHAMFMASNNAPAIRECV